MSLFFLTTEEGLPDLEAIFWDADRTSFAELLSNNASVRTDLRPLLPDHGNLHSEQVMLAFHKLQDRYRITEARVINSQSDTNYSWLEFNLLLELEEKQSGLRYQATLVFQFKMIASKMAVIRWVLQDIH